MVSSYLYLMAVLCYGLIEGKGGKEPGFAGRKKRKRKIIVFMNPLVIITLKCKCLLFFACACMYSDVIFMSS